MPHPPSEQHRRSRRRVAVAATASSGEEIRQNDILITPPGDVEVRVIGIRVVTGSWLLDATIRWRGAAPEDTSAVSLEIGVGLRITSVGRTP